MVLLLLFSFLAGFATILAPCIWPVLPIVLSSSIGGRGYQRPLGITLGIITSFTIFTLAISYFVKLFHLDPNTLRVVSVVVIIFLGLTLLIPPLATKLELFVTRLSSRFGQNLTGRTNGFISSFIVGLSLGILWTPCAGPILATVAALAAVGQVSLSVVFVTLAYVIGVSVPLFVLGVGGQQILSRTKNINQYTPRIQQIFGALMILVAIAIFTNFDQTLQLGILNKFPALGTAVNGFEKSNLVTSQLNTLKGTNTSNNQVNTSGLFNTNTPAPDFVGINNWLNTDKPLSMKDLRGKVVLVDFWTYTCINCIRTLPYTTSWYNKYKDMGFVIVGVHTPEFQFEKETKNVEDAIKRYEIFYPVAQDNDYATWNNYSNQYWPAEYLVDADGNIRRVHFGEGEYDQMEEAIQALLVEAGNKVNNKLTTPSDQTPGNNISPETYLGSARAAYYYPNGTLSNGTEQFTLSENIPLSNFSYGGKWTISDESATAGENAVLAYNFIADKVYVILRPPSGGLGTVNVYLDGKLIDESRSGVDVKNGVVKVDGERLYNIVDLHDNSANHTLKLEFKTTGTQAFTFTFG